MSLSKMITDAVIRHRKHITNRIEFNETSECALWTGPTDSDGNPFTYIERIPFNVRSAMYILRAKSFSGYTEMAYDVSCNNPRCVNPEHFVRKGTGARIFVPPSAPPPTPPLIQSKVEEGIPAQQPLLLADRVRERGASGEERIHLHV